MTDQVFVDTWGWLAAANSRDQHHPTVFACVRQLQSRRVRLVTSDYVLDELVTGLFRSLRAELAVPAFETLLAAAEAATVALEWVDAELFSAAWEMRRRFADKPTISFTDLTSMTIMRRRGISRILSGDADFVKVGLGFELLPGG